MPQTTLKEIYIEGLCSLVEVRLKLGPLTVLIGPNGAGKSNVLRALKMLSMIQTQRLRSFVGTSGGAASLLYYGPKITKELTLVCSFAEEGEAGKRELAYRAVFAHAIDDRLLFKEEAGRAGEEPREYEVFGVGHFESKLSDAGSENLLASTLWNRLSELSFFHFHDTSPHSELRTPSRMADSRYLRDDGSNLAAFLKRLETSQDLAFQRAWKRINQLTRRVVPAIRRLLPTTSPDNKEYVRLDWEDERGELFGVHHLSDGSLRAIALISALSQPLELRPKFICIDEPELGLHPSAIRLIAALARSVSTHSQVLFATQSTAFIDQFHAEEVVVVERENEQSVLRHLDTESLASWLEDYSLSELFEKGVLGGRP